MSGQWIEHGNRFSQYPVTLTKNSLVSLELANRLWGHDVRQEITVELTLDEGRGYEEPDQDRDKYHKADGRRIPARFPAVDRADCVLPDAVQARRLDYN